MIRHTTHSKQQCEARGFNPDQVLAAVRKHQEKITASNAEEVIVVIHVSKARVTTVDGSGDCVAAFIDPSRQTIKTVSWQRWQQVRRKAEVSEWVNPVLVK
jgi:hypothetical protein